MSPRKPAVRKSPKKSVASHAESPKQPDGAASASVHAVDTPSSGLKRKAGSRAAPSQLTPAKKVKRSPARAVPGSPTFEALPPVSFTPPTSLHGSRKVSFGSVDDVSDGSDVVPLSSSVVSKDTRSRKLSAKAQYMAEKSSVGAGSVVADASADDRRADVKTSLRTVPGRGERKNKVASLELPEEPHATPVNSTSKKTERFLATRASSLRDDASDESAPEVIESPVTSLVKSKTVTSAKKRKVVDSVVHVLSSGDESDALPSPAAANAHNKSLPKQHKSLEDGSAIDDQLSDVEPSTNVPSKGRAATSRKRVVSAELEDDNAQPVKNVLPKFTVKGVPKKRSAPIKPYIDPEASDDAPIAKKDVNPFIDDEAEEADDADQDLRDNSDDASGGTLETKEVTVDTSDTVMQEELQDPLLKQFYVNLPELTYCDLHPFSSATQEARKMLLYTPLMKRLLLKAERVRFRRGMNFVSYGCYFNPARIAPAALTKHQGRIVMKSARQTAVMITTGAVSNCNLVMPGSAGSSYSSYRVRNLSIYPITQEFERTISCIGSILGEKMLYGPISGSTLTFSTRKEGLGFSAAGAGPSTLKAKGLFSTVESLSRRHSTVWYPSSLSFEDKVPIYDGSSHGRCFEFKNEDFDNIKSLPLYQGGVLDLPPYAVVSVGYSVNTYSYTAGGAVTSSFALSPNILFVIVLGIPDMM